MKYGGFAPETKVHVAQGFQVDIRSVVRLQNVKELPTLQHQNRIGQSSILGYYTRDAQHQEMVDVIFSDGIITCSTDQCFWDQKNRRKVRAGDLESNTRLFTTGTPLLVRGVRLSKKYKRSTTVFSMNLLDFYNFFVVPGRSRSAVLVMDATEAL